MKVEQAGAFEPMKLTLDGVVYYYEPGRETIATVDGCPVSPDVKRRVQQALSYHWECEYAKELAERGRAVYGEP